MKNDLKFVAIFFTIVFIIFGVIGVDDADARTADTTYKCKLYYRSSHTQMNKCFIKIVFRNDDAATALNISRCESGYRAYASNGQYKGLFQVSRALRIQYKGFRHNNGLAQALHARRIYRASGRQWTHWRGFGCH